MRVLVTGGAGFIGSNFVRRLVGDAYPELAGATTVVLDKLTYAGNLANLDPVAGHPRLEFVQGDICDSALVGKLVGGADLVVNFAAESHVDRSIVDAAAFVRTNVLGTHTVLQAALDAQTPRVVHVSTDEVYGSISHGSWTEDQPLAPNSPYAASKAAADLLALAFHRTHRLPVSVTRSSNNYGPYQHPEKVIPLFVSTLLDGGSVPLYGDGGNVRDWLHVDDNCRAIALVATKGTAGSVYNVGGGAELSNIELTYRLLRLTGRDPSAVRRVPDRKGHDQRYSVDTDKIARELGFTPAVGLADGLAETVRWYRDNRSWWQNVR